MLNEKDQKQMTPKLTITKKTQTTKEKHPTVTDYKLQPFEKETIILWNQANEPATIETWDDRLMEELKMNPKAELIKEETDECGNIQWRRYSIQKTEIRIKKRSDNAKKIRSI